ncbi:MAG TPA: glycosyltransferase family 4 protein [Bacteroidia bacterium]|nr:glycosyltransferase family 4 protein [Bacteroidia bacterium]
MPKVLYIASHRKDRSPSQRFRFEQYMDYLKAHGFDYHFSYLISEKDDKIFYQPGNVFNKLRIFLKSAYKRWRDVIDENIRHYDIVFIQREAFMTGSTFFERKFKKSHAKIIFDFDDAIWHFDISEANRKFHWLKNPGKTGTIIAMSDLIFAGNNYLADFARKFNENVVLIPTTIDTEEYRKMQLPLNDSIVIGWSGSITTIKHFELAIPFLRILKNKFGKKISVKVIGDDTFVNNELGIRGIGWNKKDEIKELSSIDIGIMPLPDDEWSKGKCGLKGLQYMALEIPTVMSPVGVNTEIISDGVNGFLASHVDEWVEKISRLIESEALRREMGRKARQTVVERYSVISQQENYLKYFRMVEEK